MDMDVVKKLLTEIAGSKNIEACGLVSTDGVMLASAFSTSVDEDIIAAMSAALVAIGKRASSELGRGRAERTIVQGDNGQLLTVMLNDEMILTLLATKDARIGVLIMELNQLVKELSTASIQGE